jgi:hypothetical protein
LPQASDNPPVFPWDELHTGLVKLRSAGGDVSRTPPADHV